MSLYIVTVSFDEREVLFKHNKNNKREGHCPFGDFCSDFTGRHHSFVIETNLDINEAKINIKNHIKSCFDFRQKYHITRIERVKLHTFITDEAKWIKIKKVK
jgi:hypothetical protein